MLRPIVGTFRDILGPVLLSDPTRTITPTLDGPVLCVLATTARPLSGRRVAALAGASHSAAIAVLDRLVGAGVVDADRHSGVTLYLGNTDHIAWPAVEALAQLRAALLARMTEHLAGWAEPALAAVVVGALVAAPSAPQPGSRRGGARPEDVVETLELVLIAPDRPGPDWTAQLTGLADLTRRWSGNRCVLHLLDRAELDRRTWDGDPVLALWRRDGVPVGPSLDDVLQPGSA